MKFDRAVNQPTNLCTRGLTHLSTSIVFSLHMLCQGWTPVRQMNRFISALQPDHIAPTEVQMRIDRLCSHAWTGDFDAAMVEMGLSAARVTGQVFRKGEYAPAVSQWASEAVAPSKDMSSLVNGKCGDPARHCMPLELQGMSILQIARACRNPVASNGGHAIAALLVTHGAVDDAPDTVGTGIAAGGGAAVGCASGTDIDGGGGDAVLDAALDAALDEMTSEEAESSE